MSKHFSSGEKLKTQLTARAQTEGFDAIGVTTPDHMGQAGEHLAAFLADGAHGGMSWMEARVAQRANPSALWPDVRSVIMLGMNYGPDSDPLAVLADRGRGGMSVYARGRDYHDVIKGRLKALAGWLHSASGAEVKVFVDTAPVMEKPLAQASGIGWQGKHTNLVSREFGSWLFLGAIFTTAMLPPDTPEQSHCGTCRRCLDACPTGAFPAPYRLDARACISYLTIEHKGHIPHKFRESIATRIYGCDDCLAVCPWNRFAKAARQAKFAAGAMFNAPLSTLIRLDDSTFREKLSGSPIKRIGRNRFIRNVLIAVGNSGEVELLPDIAAHLGDPSPLVRAMAVWALRQLERDKRAVEALRAAHLPNETDEDVRGEWLREI
ncbi:MAG: tRNA epoxyqueuosine(34) reductase QueG [Alphaproteobacteria bacterium]